MHPKKHGICGFTLVELLVVLVIIALLVVIGLIYFAKSQKDARDSRRMADLRSLQAAIEDYSIESGFFPGVGKCFSNQEVGWNYSSCQNGDWDRSSDDLSQILPSSTLISVLPRDPLNVGGFPGFSYGYKAWPTGRKATYYVCTNLENGVGGSTQYGGYNYCLKGGCVTCH